MKVLQSVAGVGHLKRICKDAFRVAGAVQETCSPDMLGGPGADFLREVAFLEHRIFRFAKMILRDRCCTSYDLASLFRGRRSTLDRWKGTNAKHIGKSLVRGRQLCTQLSILEGCLAELLRFLMLSSSKVEEVSQHCCVFDVVKFKN